MKTQKSSIKVFYQCQNGWIEVPSRATKKRNRNKSATLLQEETLIDEEREAVEVEDDISRKEDLSDEDGNDSINSSRIKS